MCYYMSILKHHHSAALVLLLSPPSGWWPRCNLSSNKCGVAGVYFRVVGSRRNTTLCTPKDVGKHFEQQGSGVRIRLLCRALGRTYALYMLVIVVFGVFVILNRGIVVGEQIYSIPL